MYGAGCVWIAGGTFELQDSILSDVPADGLFMLGSAMRFGMGESVASDRLSGTNRGSGLRPGHREGVCERQQHPRCPQHGPEPLVYLGPGCLSYEGYGGCRHQVRRQRIALRDSVRPGLPSKLGHVGHRSEQPGISPVLARAGRLWLTAQRDCGCLVYGRVTAHP